MDRISRLLSAFSRSDEANRGGILNCTEVFMDLDPYLVQDSLMDNVADVPLSSEIEPNSVRQEAAARRGADEATRSGE